MLKETPRVYKAELEYDLLIRSVYFGLLPESYLTPMA
jgi:hypothetical protein